MRKVRCLSLIVLVPALMVGAVGPALAAGPHGHGVSGPGWYGPRYGSWYGPRYGPWFGPRWGPRPWGWGVYAYPVPVGVLPAPEVVEEPPVYVERAPAPGEPGSWYYCEDPQGYYPYVQQCRAEWMRVAPPPAPPGQ